MSMSALKENLFQFLHDDVADVEGKSGCFFNPLPNCILLDWSKLKASSEDTMNVPEKLKFVLGRVENIVGKGENTDYQQFLLFSQCFQKANF